MKPKIRKPKPDPLIDEVRAIRKSLEDRFDGDLGKLAEYANEVGRQFRLAHPRTVRAPSKKR